MIARMNTSTTSRIAVVLAVVALLLLIDAEALRIAHGKSVDIFHVLFGIGMLAFTVSLAGRSSRGG